jgi:hypothetical protein
MKMIMRMMIISGGTTEILKMYKSNYSAAVSVAEFKKRM